MLIHSPIELLLPSPLYVVLACVLLAILACHRGPGQPLYRARWLLIALGVWAWTLTTPALGDLLVKALEGPPDAAAGIDPAHDERTLVVVLGSGEMWTAARRPCARLDDHGWERLHAGVDLWRRTGGTMLFTGGPPGDEGASIAAFMGRIAARLGVPEDRILLSARSTSTYEDLAQVQELIRRHHGPIWLVTSAIHMPRAAAVARKLGLEVQPYPVDYRQIHDLTWRAWLPHNGGPRRYAIALHEIIGHWTYRLRGHAE